MGNRFNTAAGIARQFSAEQGKDMSRHTVSQCLREFALKAHSAVTRPPMGNIMFIVKLWKD